MSATVDMEERGGDDTLAAEYVLGVLPADERQAVAARLATDRGFASLVERWEAHLSPMNEAYEDVEPPPSLKAGLDRRLFASTAMEPQGAVRGGLWASLVFWRGLSAVALAALAAYVALPFLAPSATSPQPLVASLQAKDSDVEYVALFDKAHHQVALSHMSGERAADRDFELWMIEGKNAPVSMGVIPAGSTIRIELSPEAQRKLAAGAVLAISLEPQGGSPTGQPTGPVVAAGDLREI